MFDFWRFLAGLAIFLIGLHFLEGALKVLAGRPFKKFLRKQTTSPVKGILGGAVITVALQSSSLVSLMMMAFVGAGILTLKNAIGVIFGSNLGTTATGWIVATLGFKVDIESFAMPLVAIGGIMLILFENQERIHEFGRMIFGFGLFFIGLSFMKESVDALAQGLDVAAFQGFHYYAFFPIGVVMAALMHASSAVVVIALSALNAGIIPIESAAVMAIGADLGTTATAIVGSLRGGSAQKQVAASHFIFNLATVIIALALLVPLLWVVTDVFKFKDPLLTLVCFNSLFNTLGIIAFFPFIGALDRFLQKRFHAGSGITEHIDNVPAQDTDTAVEAMEKEIGELIDKALALNVEGLRIENSLFAFGGERKTKPFKSGSFEGHYEEVKQLQGAIVQYGLHILREPLKKTDAAKLEHYDNAVRRVMRSVKSIKDVTHDVKEFEASSNDSKFGLYQLLKGKVNELYLTINKLVHAEDRKEMFKLLLDLVVTNKAVYQATLQEAYRQVDAGRLTDVETSTFINANREIYSANKALILAMSDVMLTPQKAEEFDRLPEVS
jgi:phosphate:Na+ symporter